MSGEALPIRSIRIAAADLRELQQDAWSKQMKPVQLELEGSSYKAQFGYRGGHTRGYRKKSYEVRINGGRILHWNAEYDDPSMMRNALSFYFFNKIGVLAPKTKHFWLIINGEPQGVYLEIESVDELFFRERGRSWKSIIYAVNDSANFSLIDPITKSAKTDLFDGYEVVSGGAGTKTRLRTFLASIHKLPRQKLQPYLARRLDIDQYLLWLAGAVLTGNYDGFDQNYALYEHGGTGKYRILPWDYEGTWGRNCYGKPCGSNLVRLEGYNHLTQAVLSYSAYRQQYKKVMTSLLRDAFTTDELVPVIQQMHSHIDSAIRHDHTRGSSYATFASEPAFMRQYISERRDILKTALQEWKPNKG
ncbi:CotH kinase family protein [Paenibacillus sp. GCM10023252]|uniref:CotH kinase family protein n=1 Tax=Paenibacillus sp. GCM10023252 TaxID=3252649 RepID=UPI003616E053